MGILYAAQGKIYCKDYMEIYIPSMYFENNSAINKGSSIESIGIVYTKAFPNGNEEPLRIMNLPIVVNFMIYDFKYEPIKVHGKTLDVMTLKYPKDSYVLHQTVTNGREVAEAFLESILSGKLPKTLNYEKIIDMWWRNLEISGVSFKVPSKIFEMIIATIYRSPNDPKKRYGQYYGKQVHPDGYDYKTGNVRNVVDEPISPLEKIIHY